MRDHYDARSEDLAMARRISEEEADALRAAVNRIIAARRVEEQRWSTRAGRLWRWLMQEISHD
jgi:hypothetical protein